MLQGKADVALTDLVEVVHGRQRGVGLAHGLEEIAVPFVAHRGNDLLLAAEVLVQPGRAIVDAVGQGAHGEGGRPFFGDDLAGGVQDGLFGAEVAFGSWCGHDVSEALSYTELCSEL